MLCTFSVRMIKHYFKNSKYIFFCLQKVGKTTRKSCILLWEFFFSLQPDCSKFPRTSFLFYKFFYPTSSCRISDSVSLACNFCLCIFLSYCSHIGLHKSTFDVQQFFLAEGQYNFGNKIPLPNAAGMS